MIFKNWANNINNVALAIDSIKDAKIAGTVKELNDVSLNNFVKGIDGLSLSQAQAALSTRSLTDAQKEQILMSAGLLKSTKELTLAEVKKMASDAALTVEKEKEILTNLQGAYSENEWNEERLEAIVLEGGEAGAIAKTILAKKAENAENAKNIASTKALTSALKKQLLTLAKNPITWVAVGLVGVVAVAHQCSQAIKEVREKAQELNETFDTSKTEIEDYKTQIEDLYETINDSGSSIEDVTTARQNLMSIQDQLIEKFGKERDTINLITDAINGQSDALDVLTEKQWQIAKNEFNKSGFWNTLGNVFEGYSSNVDRMVDEYENYSVDIDTTQFGGTLFTEGQLEFRQALLDNFGGEQSTRGKSIITISGNASEVKQKLLDLQKLIDENDAYKPDDDFIDYLGNLERATDDTINQYEDFYKQYTLYEEIFPNEAFSDSYNEINKAYSDYHDSLVSGDEETIKKAQDNFANILTQATKGVSDESVVDFFNDMYPDLRDEVGAWQFETDFTVNTDGLKDQVSNSLVGLDGFSSEDILKFNPIVATQEQIDSYNILNGVATQYGLTLEELVNLLIKMGLVQSENYQQLVNQFGQDNVSQLTPEDLTYAYKIKNIGNMTFAELQAEIQRMKEEASKTSVIEPFSISETIDALNTQLKPAFDDMKSAYEEIFEGSDLHLEKVSTDMLVGFKSTIDELNEIDGVSIDVSAYEDFATVLTNTSSTAQDVEKAFDDYATSIVNGVTATKGFSDETRRLATTLLEEMGVVNASEVVHHKMVQTKIDNLVATKRLSSELVPEIQNMLVESDVSEQAAQSFMVYTLKKIMSNKNWINEDASIENVKKLGKAVGIATPLIEAYLKAKAGKMPTVAAMETIKAFERQLSEIETDVDVDYSPVVEGAGSAGKDAAEEFAKMLEAELDVLDKKMDAGYLNFNDYLNQRLALIDKYYQQGKISAKEYYDYLNSHYEKQLSYMDRVISAVTKKISDQVEQLEKQKESIEETYNLQISRIQEEIELLQKEADKKSELIDLEKARYEAERLRHQRTKKIYKDGQFVYEADDAAVREAEQNLADQELKMNISRLEEEIEKLETAMDDATNQIDEQIDQLQDYADQWQDVANAYEDAQNDMLAAMMLSANWEADILASRQDVLAQFKDAYIRAQQEMADAAVKAAEAQVKAANSAPSGSGGGSGGSGSGSGGGSGNKKIPDDEPHKYNGTVYGTKKEAEKAKQNDIDSLNSKLRTFKTSGNTSADEAQKAAIKDQIRQIEKRPITKCAKGGVVKNDDNFLSSIAQSVGEDTMVAVKEGERILTPVQNENFEKLVRIADNLSPVIPTSGLGGLSPDFTKLLGLINNQKQEVHNTFNITLPNIHDGSKAVDLFNEFQNLHTKGMQYFNAKK